MDPAELRLKNFIRPEQFPYTTKTGWTYDSGDYETTMREALRDRRLRRAAPRAGREARARRAAWASASSFFTETVGAGPRKRHGHRRPGHGRRRRAARAPDRQGGAAHLASRRRARATRRRSRRSSPRSSASRPRTSRSCTATPTRRRSGSAPTARRSTPVSGAAAAVVARKIRDKARLIAGAMLEVSPDDLEWEKGRWFVKGDPEKGKTIQEIALAPHGALELPEGVEGHLDAEAVYNPPNLTYPYGAYICVVDVDPGTGQVKVRRFIAVDDCGVRINPMIVEGQIHGGLADGVGIALMQHIAFDEQGNCLSGSLMDYLVPTLAGGARLGAGRDRHAVAAPPDRRQGRGRVGQRRLAAGGHQRGRRRARRRSACATSTCPPRPRGCGRRSRAAPRRRRDDHAQLSAGEPRRCRGRSRSSRRPSCAARRPTSARPGDRAIVLGDGTIEGFVGGACADATVRLQALRALETGEPCCCGSCRARPTGRARSRAPSWSRNPCLSGGALELFLEPHLPPPRVAVAGDSPVARALAELPAPLGFARAAWTRRPSRATSPPSSRRSATATRRRSGAGSRPAASTSGSSRRTRRGAAVLDALRAGRDGRRRARARAHARGRRHRRAHAREIALAILAELVAAARARRRDPDRAGSSPSRRGRRSIPSAA